MNDAFPGDLSTDPDARPDYASDLHTLWSRGQRPDVDEFLARVGPLPPAEAVSVLRVDQRERWRAGDRVPAEAYLQRHPAVADDADAAIDVIFSEFLLREQLGERPAAAEYLSRFPQHAAVLGPQIELHQALAAGDASTATVLPEDDPDRPTVVPAGFVLGQLPESFGRYRIVRLLGRGGMGEVYLARDTQLGREVALKVTRFGGDSGQVERFQREAKIAAALDHPHLCPIFDVGRHDSVHYLTMPLLRGEALSDRLRRDGALPPPEAARIAVQVARAVAVAHRAGVVHRDLKPSNVMMEERGPVVMDFGMAHRSAGDDPRLTASGAVAGTPAYLAPERIGGESHDPEPSCDVYSLGVMLYEMLTGQLPFRGTIGETLRRTLTEPPQPPSQLRPGIDARLEGVCLRALEKEPARRFATMEAFADALDACVDGQATAVRRPRRGWLIGAAVALGLALLGCVGWAASLAFLPWGERQEQVKDGGAKKIEKKPEEPPDGFAQGSQWTGEYRGDDGNTGTIEVAITERTGDVFKGMYFSRPKGEEGVYGWTIGGTVRDNHVECEFTDWIRQTKGSQRNVGRTWIKGEVKNGALTGTYEDRIPGDDPWHARVVLRRQK